MTSRGASRTIAAASAACLGVVLVSPLSCSSDTEDGNLQNGDAGAGDAGGPAASDGTQTSQAGASSSGASSAAGASPGDAGSPGSGGTGGLSCAAGCILICQAGICDCDCSSAGGSAGAAGGAVGTGGATGGASTGGANTGGGAGVTGGTGGTAGTGGVGGSCEELTTLEVCDSRADCHAVFYDPATCGCAISGCCAQFLRCAEGALATCEPTGAIGCTTATLPYCEPPYVVSYGGDCYEGCVREEDCAS